MSEQMQKLSERYEKATGKKFNSITNADHIRSMTDEELAENFCDKKLTKKMWLEWLKQPYKEDADG